MYTFDFCFGRRFFFLFCCIFLLVAAAAAPQSAPAADGFNAENVVAKSLKAIWTGKKFDTGLEKGQQQLQKLLRAGKLGRTELRKMIEARASSMLERYVTSRYILRNASQRFDSVFAPYLTWKDAKKAIWKAGLSKAKSHVPMLITVGTLAPSGTPWINIPEKVTKPKIAMLSRGKILMKIYTGGVMGQDTDILRKMDIGQLDGCGCTALGVVSAAPELSVFLAPGLFKNYDEVDYIYKKFRKRIDNILAKRKYIPVALIDTGFMYIFSKKRTTSLEELRKRKVVTWFGDIETTMDKELGVRPIPVAVPEIISALNSGLADTNISPPAWMLGMQAYQYSNYYISPPLFYSPAVVLVSTRTKDRLQKRMGVSNAVADNFLELIVHEFNIDEREWRRQIREYEAKCLKAFKTKTGIKEITLSPADQAEIRRASAATMEKLAGKAYPKDFLNDILNALRVYRKTGR